MVCLYFFFGVPGIELGTVLTSITANDVDTNPALTYSFVDEASDPDATSIFAIDRFSGKVILRQRLDYETRQEYQLKISASDTSHLAQTTLTIRVTDQNDNAPIFQQPAYHTILPGKLIQNISLQHSCHRYVPIVVSLFFDDRAEIDKSRGDSCH